MATQVSLNDGAVASAGALAIQTNGTTQAVSISTGQVATLAQNPILTSGTANGVAYLNGSKALTTGSALTFDGTNLGIGTSSPANKLDVSATGSTPVRFTRTDGVYVLNLVGTGTSSAGALGMSTNDMVFLTNGSERARIDSSGKLLLGVTSGTGLSGGDFAMGNGKSIRFRNAADSAYISAFEFTSANGLNIGTGGSLSTITFGISGIGEAGRFDASGNLLVGTNGQTNLERLGVVFTGNNEGAYFANGSASPTGSGITVNFSNATGTNGTACILYKGRTAGADRFYVYGNGNVVNINNSYGSLSDIKHKENIVDATPKLEKLNQVRVVNFNIKGDSQKQIGVIAQELEQVFPSMVDESPDRDAEGNDLGTTTKSVKYSVFVPILIKAIQEQQALITQLTARITALEGA